MSSVMIQAPKNATPAHSMAPQSVASLTGTCLVPRCEIRFEKTANGCKLHCQCDDDVAVATLQNLCRMLSGQCCSLCCTFNGQTCCQVNLCCCHCSCEPTVDGCCITCETGDTACCELTQKCCEAVAACIANGCCCTVCFGDTPVCCCCD